jgi:hypothetical protein
MYARKKDASLTSEQGYLPPRTPAAALALSGCCEHGPLCHAAQFWVQLGPRAEVALILAVYIPMCRQLPLGGCALHGGAMTGSSAQALAPDKSAQLWRCPRANVPGDRNRTVTVR